MTASEEYVRTARQIVTKIQIEVNRVITTGRPCEYIEDETLEALCQEAASRGANPARIRKRHAVMNQVHWQSVFGISLSNFSTRR